MSDTYLSDNTGNRSSPTPESSDPKETQTALKLTNGSADTNTTATVVVGKSYRFTALKTGGFYLGLADVTTAGNVRWVCPLYRSIEIKIPIGSTTLHYATDTINGIGYLVELN